MSTEKFIVIYGDPVEGFAHVGPFDTHAEAVEYATVDAPCGWWVTHLHTPDTDNIIQGEQA
jgi:hypothetical protein